MPTQAIRRGKETHKAQVEEGGMHQAWMCLEELKGRLSSL